MLDIFIAILKRKRALFLIYVLIIAGAITQALQLGFSHKRERFFPANNTDLAFTKTFFKALELDDIYVLIGIETANSVLSKKSKIEIEKLTNHLETEPYVLNCVSITNLKLPKKAGASLYNVPLLTGNRQKDSLTIVNHPLIYKSLVAEDFSSTCLLVKTIPIAEHAVADKVYNGINDYLKDANFKDYHLGGFPVMQSVTVRELGKEMQFYVALSCALLVIILLIIYRSLAGLFIPLLSLVGGLSIFFAYLHVSGQSLDIMSTLYPILMLIFLMADVIHLQTHFIDEIDSGKSPYDALMLSIKEIGLALFLTSFTTAVGFGALVTSKIEAIRQFGFNSAVGVMIAYVCVVVFAASALLFFKPGQLSKAKQQNARWKKAMNWLYIFNKTNSRLIVSSVALLLVIAGIGISNISTNAYIKGDLPDRIKLKQDFEFFEKNYGGVRTFEMAVLPQQTLTMSSPKVLLELNKLNNYLVDTHKMNNIVSPLSAYKMVHQAYTRGKSNFEFPTEISQIERYSKRLKLANSNSFKKLESEDGLMGRISARQQDNGSNLNAQNNADILKWVNKNIDSNTVKFKITGTALMFDQNHSYLRISLFKTLLLAFLIVGILFAILFKDYRMVLVSLIPNVLPLLLAAAAMGFLNIKLQALTSIFFAISFGIAVDDTIHFLTRFKLERKKGRTIDKAIKITMKISGKAIILTSMILVVSFFTLTLSNFRGTYYIGVLMCITLIGALLADLFLLPQLLYFANRKRIKNARKNVQQS